MARAVPAYPEPSEAARQERDEQIDRVVASGSGGQEWASHVNEVEK
jgi:hypothetical protein